VRKCPEEAPAGLGLFPRSNSPNLAGIRTETGVWPREDGRGEPVSRGTGRRVQYRLGAFCGYDGLVSLAGRYGMASLFLATGVALLAGWACRPPPPDPISFVDRAIIVENQTASEWQNVEVWLNDHYRVTKSRMPPGERFSIPFSSFVAGFGQRFDAAGQPIRGVEVTATAPGGQKVRIVWGSGRRR
jgi:hypothetical protein